MTRCGATTRDGWRCRAWRLADADHCRSHLTDVDRQRRAMAMLVRAGLVEAEEDQ